MENGRLTEAVRAVGQFLVADVPLGETLQRIATVARDALPTAAAVGLTMLDERGKPTTAVYTDDVVVKVDQGQYDEGDGPCLEAFRTGQVVLVDDMRTMQERWPPFTRDALDAGILSILSLPLQAGEDRFGAFNVYGRELKAFDDAFTREAALFVTQVSVVLANARAYWTAFDMASGLQQALQNRAVIEQAKGKIMATNGCSADEAFEILVRASQRENVKVRELARRIVGETSADP